MGKRFAAVRFALATVAACAAAAGASGCRIGGVNALPPIVDDAAPAGTPDAEADGDATPPADAAPDAAPAFHGLVATIGDRPEVTGSCTHLPDYATMESHFTSAAHVMPVRAGWDFDTSADAYSDPSFGFDPNWPAAPSERFSVRYHGHITIAAGGKQCFSVDIGAFGTDIITGSNGCGQVYLNAGTQPGQAARWLAETGYDAPSTSAATACVDLAAGEYPIDIVFWYFNIFNQAKLHVRHCNGGGATCTPDQPIAASDVTAVP